MEVIQTGVVGMYVFSVLVVVIRHILRGYGSEFQKTRRGFSQAWAHSQKPLSFFQ